MSLPPLNPDKTTAGISVNPRTLERVVPESRRPDGSVRKEIKIRPGFTPQEDVRRFRGTKQTQMDSAQLPKGHIVGWVPPSSQEKKPLSKSAKKNAKRKEKRQAVTTDAVKDNWEDEDDDEEAAEKPSATDSAKSAESSKAQPSVAKSDVGSATPSKAKSPTSAGDELASKLDKLEVK